MEQVIFEAQPGKFQGPKSDGGWSLTLQISENQLEEAFHVAHQWKKALR